MKLSVYFWAFPIFCLVSFAAEAQPCYLQNNSPYSPVGHMSPQLTLSPRIIGSDARFVRLMSGAQIQLTLVSETNEQVEYVSADPRQEIRVEITKVGNVEDHAVVTVGRALPADYVCSNLSSRE